MKNHLLAFLTLFVCTVLFTTTLNAQNYSGVKPIQDFHKHNGYDPILKFSPVVENDTLAWIRFQGRITGPETWYTGSNIMSWITGPVTDTYFPANMVFRTGDRMRMTIRDNGYIGVNTFLPEQLFTVSNPVSPVIRFDQSDPGLLDFELSTSDIGDLIFRGGINNSGPALPAPALNDLMTLTYEGHLGIGVYPDYRLDVNGNAWVRGTSLFLGGEATFPTGGEALGHSNTDCDGSPAGGEVLVFNRNNDFGAGVYVEGDNGLHVCGPLEAECLRVKHNVVSEIGNLVALGDSGVDVACYDAGEGSFVSHGSEGDFVANGYEGDFIAYGNEGDFIANGDNGNFITHGGDGDFIANGIDGDFIANGDEGDFITMNGDLIAEKGSLILGTGIAPGSGGTALMHSTTGGYDDVGSPDVLVLNPNSGESGGFTGGVRVDGPGLIIGNGIEFTGNPGTHRLAVAGSIISEEVVVKMQINWPDYVFGPDHEKMPLEEVSQFVTDNKHLPGVPSAQEISEEGLKVGQMQVLMMEKMEELFLHVIELNEKVAALEAENSALRQLVKEK